MTAHIAVLASLGAVIILSPEVLLLGLLAASDKKMPRRAAMSFAFGAAVGIAAWFLIGTFIAPSTHHEEAHLGWPAFWIRVGIATMLLVLGTIRAIGAIRGSPVEPVRLPEQAHGEPRGLHALINRLLTTDGLPTPRRIVRAFMIGVVASGHSPKIFPVAMAAGYQAMQIHPVEDRVVGTIAFASLSVLPGLMPLAIEMLRPGSSAGLREVCERFMKRNSRTIVAILLIGIGLYVAWHAWSEMPAT